MKKKVINLTVIMIMAVSLFAVAPLISDEARAAMSVTKVNSSTVIDSEYSFAPRFISGKTILEGFGGSSYSDDLWSLNSDKSVYYWPSEYKYPIRLTSSSQKGKIGVWYRNVGEYNGKMLDMKITLADWTELRSPITISTTEGNKVSYPTLFFDKTKIKVDVIGGYIKAPQYKFEFFDKQGNRVNITGHINMLDIDDNQYVQSDDFSRVYVTSNSNLSLTGSNKLKAPAGAVADGDQRGWATVLIESKNTFSFKFANQNQDNENYQSVKRSNRGFYTILMDGNSLARFNTPAPVKTGPLVISAGENVSYSVAFTVPQQPSGYLYSKFYMTDALPEGLTYKGFSVKDDTGADVSSLFTGDISGQNFTLTANSPSASNFYFKGYTVTINAVADEDFTGKQDSNGNVILKNQASITAQNTSTPETKNSNVVSTEVMFNIKTATDGNGTITESMDSITGGSSRTISFNPNAGYEIASVTVDGQKIENVESYTFSNIAKNHSIAVRFKPTEDNEIVLTKKIKADDVNISNGTPTAIFKVEGTDLNGENHVYQRIVQLTEETLQGDYYTVSVTFDNLTAGTYTATEIDTARYDIKSIIAGQNASVSGDKLSCDLINGKRAEGTFTNEKVKFNLFTHNFFKDNIFMTK